MNISFNKPINYYKFHKKTTSNKKLPDFGSFFIFLSSKAFSSVDQSPGNKRFGKLFCVDFLQI
ncbi:hypothetical protein PEDI_18710 [Persicobacter diffluens]|uniref:Uncharacterized protein n=1 Tax=Persicobacter diffluens TaxID=981 RepID=A0AAN4VWD1_9BACT|nr:hypothetical protein PEDI_18710 [Persicobacter diffluens]